MNARHIIALLLLLPSIVPAAARTYLIEPQWHVGKSEFREAYINEKGMLIDSYTRMDSDTVNVIDLGTDNYTLDISVDLHNYHCEPYTSYAQYYTDPNGKKRKARRRVRHPIHGWVWGMSDMRHYNAILMRHIDAEHSLYMPYDMEYCVLTVNGNDTTYHVPWTKRAVESYMLMGVSNRLWLQYRNNSVWIGGGYNADIPWAVVHNVHNFGSYTGLYLGSAAKVGVCNAVITVNAKEEIEHTPWRQESLAEYFELSETMPVEGFWKIRKTRFYDERVKIGGQYHVAIVADSGSYNIIYLDGAKIYPGKWKEGMVKGRMKRNGEGFYEVVWYDAEGERMENVLGTLTRNFLFLSFPEDNAILTLAHDTQPQQNADKENYSNSKTGTGFAIHRDGYVATAFHVIEGCEYIKLYHDMLTMPMDAEVVATDSINDIAILKIKELPLHYEPPYTIETKELRRGEKIFTLGYPQSYILGNELKMSNGIVSATNGDSPGTFMTDLNADHGSSGSPAFNSAGDVVGIIKSIYTITRISTTIVIKTRLLLRLMEKAGIEPAPSPSRHNKGLSQPDMVSATARYVYLIECR